jgi:hypothetical protein
MHCSEPKYRTVVTGMLAMIGLLSEVRILNIRYAMLVFETVLLETSLLIDNLNRTVPESGYNRPAGRNHVYPKSMNT